MDDGRGDLFDEEPLDERPDAFAQDGPDLFGTTPDELLLPPEPIPVDDPEVDVEMDEVDEIPIDPEEGDEIPIDPDGEDVPTASPLREAVAADEGDAPAASGRGEGALALYRRYRPDTFDEVIGQDHVTDPLRRALINNRVNHAYLFSGPRGCGKTTSARILARCLNCEQGPTPTPCGQCRSCRDLARGGPGSIDVIEMDAATHGLVDDARSLRERAFFSPVHSLYKIYIIDEAHMVTPQGFNALLKVVEEPPPHVKFIFATTEPEKVLGTIRSRTHHYPFRLVPPKVLLGYLQSLCEAENVQVDPAVMPLVVRAGAGSVRDSLSVLDQLLGSAPDTGVSYAQATGLLGYTPDTLLDEILDAFAAGDASGVFASIDKVIEVGQDARRFAEDLLRRLRDLIIVAAVPDALTSGLVDVAGDQAERLTTQAAGMGAGELTRAAEVIAQGLTEMRGTTAPRLHLELMCARVLLPGADVDARGIHARLDRLERRLSIPAQPAEEAEHPSRREASPTPRPAVESPGSAPGAATPRAPFGAPMSSPPARASAEPSSGSQRDESAAPLSPAVGGLGTADIRHMWPQVLDAVKNRRRVTWIVLSQNVQVHAFADNTLTLSANNPGARDSLSRGGSDDVVREAILEVLGVAPRIEVVLDDRQPPPVAQPNPTGPPGPPTSTDHERPEPAAPARRNVRRTQLRSPATASDPEPERNDPDLDEAVGEVDDLLRRQLGAELLTDEPSP